MSDATHVTENQLVRAIDGEMTVVEQADFDAHLVRCEACLERYEALAEFSNEVEKAIDSTPVRAPRGAREQLAEALAAGGANVVVHSPRRVQVWWWAAAAASIAILFFVLHDTRKAVPDQESATRETQMLPSSTTPSLEKSGVSQEPLRRRVSGKELRAKTVERQKAKVPGASAFLPLPYADVASPLEPAGLVRVRMQLSMLANAGVIRMSPGAPDAPVEADVLLGIDGEPYAIRLVSASQ